MKTIVALVGLVAVAGCQSLPTLPLTAAARCSEALLSTASTDPLTLAITAATTPACQMLAGDVLETVIDDVRAQIAKKHQHAPLK